MFVCSEETSRQAFTKQLYIVQSSLILFQVFTSAGFISLHQRDVFFLFFMHLFIFIW